MKNLCLVMLLFGSIALHAEDASGESQTKSLSLTMRSATQWIKKHPARALILAGVVLYIPVSLYELWLQQQELDAARLQLATCQNKLAEREAFITNTFNKINQKLGLDKLAKK